MDTGAGPDTFTGRYGLAQYNGRLASRYPPDGPCELGACRLLRADQLDRAQAGKLAAERQLTTTRQAARQLDARYRDLLAWQPRLDRTRRQRRRELDASRQCRAELAAEADRLEAVILPMFDALIAQACDPPQGRAAMLVFDHCHRHGWVRGLICMACNNALIALENDGRVVHHGAVLQALETYLRNCPGCVPRQRLA